MVILGICIGVVGTFVVGLVLAWRQAMRQAGEDAAIGGAPACADPWATVCGHEPRCVALCLDADDDQFYGLVMAPGDLGVRYTVAVVSDGELVDANWLRERQRVRAGEEAF